jgi:hypothetical protein
MIGATYRLFRLKAWLVRALIGERHAGTYLLYRRGKPVYAGRSDRDLRRRLVTHAHHATGDYFGFSVHPDAERAYDMECALFHALHDVTTNRIHPASPKGSDRRCFICDCREKGQTFSGTLQRGRLRTPST